MSEPMASDSERDAPDELVQKLEATLRQLRAAATPPPAPPESWLKKKLSPDAPSSHQAEFNAALVDALNQLVSAWRETAARQEKRLAQLAEELSEMKTVSENLDAFRAHSDGVGSELRAVATSVRGLQERAAALEGEVARSHEQQLEKIRQLTSERDDLRREFQERIQQLLDEQRVCIRQLSLQASEEAVLADRARRAAELKLEELARRVPAPPA